MPETSDVNALEAVTEALAGLGLLRADFDPLAPLAACGLDSVDCLDLGFRLERTWQIRLADFGPAVTAAELAERVRVALALSAKTAGQ